MSVGLIDILVFFALSSALQVSMCMVVITTWWWCRDQRSRWKGDQ